MVQFVNCTTRLFVRGGSGAEDLGFGHAMTSFCGHQGDPEKTAANIQGDFWLTGDQGIKDQDGYFQFLGRGDDIINSSG